MCVWGGGGAAAGGSVCGWPCHALLAICGPSMPTLQWLSMDSSLLSLSCCATGVCSMLAILESGCAAVWTSLTFLAPSIMAIIIHHDE